MNNIIVTTPSKDLRALSREALKGKWKIAAIGTLIFFTVVMVPMIMLSALFGQGSIAASIYMLLVGGAFALGYSMFTLNIFRNKEIEYVQLFYGFEKIFKTIGLYLYIYLFVVLWSLLFFIPGIIAAIRYSQSFFIFVDNPDMPITEIVNESKRMMKGNKEKFFCLNFSFIGWDILAAIPTGIVNVIFGAASFSTNTILMTSEYGYGAATDILSGTNVLIAGLVGLVAMGAYIWLTPYIDVSMVAFYEIIQGNLRPGAIEVDGYVVDDLDKSSENTTYREDASDSTKKDAMNDIPDWTGDGAGHNLENYTKPETEEEKKDIILPFE